MCFHTKIQNHQVHLHYNLFNGGFSSSLKIQTSSATQMFTDNVMHTLKKLSGTHCCLPQSLEQLENIILRMSTLWINYNTHTHAFAMIPKDPFEWNWLPSPALNSGSWWDVGCWDCYVYLQSVVAALFFSKVFICFCLLWLGTASFVGLIASWSWCVGESIRLECLGGDCH